MEYDAGSLNVYSPSILHFNGNGKDVQEAFHQRLGLRGQHAMRSAFRDLVQPVQYDAVCPDSQ